MARAVVFDAYGTLFDVQSVLAQVEAACPGRGAVIAQLWRLKQLEYSWLHSLMGGPFRGFWTVTRQALNFALAACGVTLPAAQVDALAAEYNRLAPYPEVRAALAALPARRAILSNGGQPMLDALVVHAGFGDLFDAVISVDAAAAFKPDARCYALVEAQLGVPPAEVVFVSSNGFDIAGARRFGFKTVWVQRAAAPPAPEPASLYALLRTQPEMLDAPADHVAASVDFPLALRQTLGLG